jgi:tetratricopeptide (TPR) repeat protein
VRAYNPFKIISIAILVLALLAGAGFLVYNQQQRRQAATAAAASAATSAIVQATAQVATAGVRAIEQATAARATAAAADLEQRYQAAVAFQQAGSNEQARAAFQELIALHPGYKDCAARLKQVSDALAEAAYQQGLAASDQKLWGDAVAAFDKALVVEPGYKDAATRRAAALKAGNATPTAAPSALPTATPTAQPTEPGATPTVLTATTQMTETAVTVGVTSATTTAPKEPAGDKPPGDWAVRSYNTDDVAAVFVNGKLVTASLGGDHADSGWVKINEYLVAGENEIAVASWNSSYGRSWGFGVRRNDTQVWGSEAPGQNGPVGMSYVQRVRITPEGQVAVVPSDTAAPKPPPGKWYVRAQGIQDVGVVLVNGVPTVLNALAFARDSDWIEITGQLASSHDNTVVVVAWNFDGSYSYKFDLKHDETIVWGAEKSGGGQVGVVLSQPVSISGSGEVRQ